MTGNLIIIAVCVINFIGVIYTDNNRYLIMVSFHAIINNRIWQWHTFQQQKTLVSKIHGCLHIESRVLPWLVHNDVIKWKHFPRYRPFVRGIHRSPVTCPHKGQWRGALLFSLICAWINDWVNNREAGDLRGHRAHHDVTVMSLTSPDVVITLAIQVTTKLA